ncbi:MAG: hypothetical protein JWN72_1235, partial [Thermoleophilia bacterium]|nr:hypothetical protein [Thermoleophilia bacterium]
MLEGVGSGAKAPTITPRAADAAAEKAAAAKPATPSKAQIEHEEQKAATKPAGPTNAEKAAKAVQPEAPKPTPSPTPAPAPEAPRPQGAKAKTTPAPTPTPIQSGGAPKDKAPKGDAKGETTKLTPNQADHAAEVAKSKKNPATGANAVADAATDARGDATDNDGRADDLRSDNYSGGRDTMIDIIKSQTERLLKEHKADEERADELRESTKAKDQQTEIISTVAKVTMAPLAFVTGLFGADPIKDVTANLTGATAEHEKLDEQTTKVDKGEKTIKEKQENLQGEVVFNFLSDVAHVTGMDDSVSRVLDGRGGINYDVQGSTGLGSDAAYDSGSKNIIVDSEVVHGAAATLRDLQRQGIVDSDGNIINAQAFDASKAGDAAIGTTALLGVHEVTHAAQDSHGGIKDSVKAANAASEAYIAAHPKPVSDAQGDHLSAGAAQAGEAARVDSVEYDAYVNQETVELQAGKEKQGFVTINPDGSLLPREQATQNIEAFQNGLALPYGASAGQTFNGESSDAGGDEGGEGETPGRRAPGDDA